MSEDRKPFSVTDRRHFTSEGDVRKPNADEPAAVAGPPAPTEGASAPAAVAPAAVAGPSTPLDADEALVDEGPAPRYPADFLGLLISLGAQASVLLMGGPEGEEPDLESAQALIELLGSLREKTEGHRTPQEDQLLEGLLYELRMTYVRATKAAGR